MGPGKVHSNIGIGYEIGNHLRDLWIEPAPACAIDREVPRRQRVRISLKPAKNPTLHSVFVLKGTIGCRKRDSIQWFAATLLTDHQDTQA